MGKEKMFIFRQEGYELPQPVEKTTTANNMVSFGNDNRYSQFLWALYENCGLFEALVDNTVDYICGDEIKFTLVPEAVETDMEELFRKVALDMVLYNACAVQRVYNKLHQLVGVYYLDQTKVRYSEDLQTLYYADNWGSYTKKYVTIPINDPMADTDAVIFRNYSKAIYPTPCYQGAIKSIVTLSKISEFHLNNISNGFSASALINFNNGVPDEETKNSIETALRKKFAGVENAGKFLVSYNDSADNAATVEKLDDDKFDVKYAALKEAAIEDVHIAFRCPSQLLGIADQNTGFSAIEYKNAFALYNKTMISPFQKKMKTFFKNVFGVDDVVEITPYSIPELVEN